MNMSVADLGFEKGVPLSKNVDCSCTHTRLATHARKTIKRGFRGTQGTPLDPPLHVLLCVGNTMPLMTLAMYHMF